jgi:hypothetical protein
VSSLLTIDYLFTIGLGFDVAGARMLGRGLLSSPDEIAYRSTTPREAGMNFPFAISQIKARIDGEVGMRWLLIGFGLQGIAYAATIAGAPAVTTSVWAGLIALLLGLVAYLGAMSYLGVWRATTRHRRLAIDVARVDHKVGGMHADPDGPVLVALGEELLGWPRVQGPDGVPIQSDADYIGEHFGDLGANPRAPDSVPTWMEEGDYEGPPYPFDQS